MQPKVAIECFMLEPSDMVRDTLRRYARERLMDGSSNMQRQCPLEANGFAYHNAEAEVGDRVEPTWRAHGFPMSRSDRRWPTACKCGYTFEALDEWSFIAHRLWRRVGTHELMRLDQAPAGAMWYAEYMDLSENEDLYLGPDGRCLVVQTPGGEWWVDGPSTEEPQAMAWRRKGKLPKLSVTPGVVLGSFHGRLTDGFLVTLPTA